MLLNVSYNNSKMIARFFGSLLPLSDPRCTPALYSAIPEFTETYNDPGDSGSHICRDRFSKLMTMTILEFGSRFRTMSRQCLGVGFAHANSSLKLRCGRLRCALIKSDEQLNFAEMIEEFLLDLEIRLGARESRGQVT
jgi:hypothetical protein